MSRSKRAAAETPSKRFRDILYNLWLQDEDGHVVFDDYYADRMEKLIVHYKKKINGKR